MDHAPLSWVRSLKWTFVLIGVTLALSLAATLAAYIVQDSKQARNARSQALSAESTNRLVCVTRPYILGAKKRAEATAKVNPNPVTRATAKQAVASSKVYLRGLVTVPPTFDCRPLVKQIKREAQREADRP